MTSFESIPLPPRFRPQVSPEIAARHFCDVMRTRRTVREFSSEPVSLEAVQWLVKCAASAPSGANKQPWRFVCVSDPGVKRAIRLAAEEEERAFYAGKAGEQWLADLEPFGTDPNKPFLEEAPWLIVVFRLTRGEEESPVYYGMESVGIAVGMLLTAAHFAGLATLTHTPNPMSFLNEVLGRPVTERPYLIIPVGYPADNCRVPVAAFNKKPLDEVMLVRSGLEAEE